jgi:CBS domain-containing membrane protein
MSEIVDYELIANDGNGNEAALGFEEGIKEESTADDLCDDEKNDLTREPVAISIKAVENVDGKKPTEDPSVGLAFLLNVLFLYFRKFSGIEGHKCPPMTKSYEIPLSSILAFIGLLLVTVTDHFFMTVSFHADHDGEYPISLLTGAFGATSVLLYEGYQSPFAQPRNVFGSYAVCSFCGVSARLICDLVGLPRYVTVPVAGAVGVLGMNLTKTVHPPGGAVAITAVLGDKMIEGIGYGYCLTAIGGALIMITWAVIGNNLILTRRFPLYWY